MSTDIVKQIHKKNSVKSNSFDLSHRKTFMACPGMLLPVHVMNLLPFQKTYVNYSNFMRTLPLSVPTFGKAKIKFDTYFVPLRLLGSDFQSITVGDERGILENYSDDGTYKGNSQNVHLPQFDYVELLVELRNYVNDPTSRTLPFGSLFDAADNPQAETTPILLNRLGYGIMDSLNSIVGVDYIQDFGAQNPRRAVKMSNNKNSLATDNGSVNSADVENILNTQYNYVDNIMSGDAVQMHTFVGAVTRLAAYQKIYQDFYRNKLWEKENKMSYYFSPNQSVTLSNLVSRGVFEMRYEQFAKDNLTGLVPNENALLSDGIGAIQALLSQRPYGSDPVAGFDQQYIFGNVQVPAGWKKATPVNSVESLGFEEFSTFSVYRMEAMQKFAEICQMNKSDYKHQIQAHFGRPVGSLNSDYCKYLGGYTCDLDVQTVANTTSEDPASISGIGTSSGNGYGITVNEDEHGVLMTIMSIVPYVEHTNFATDRQCLEIDRYDFPVPEFANLGFEPVRVLDIVNPFCYPHFNDLLIHSLNSSGDNPNYDAFFGLPSQILGYLPRYWWYKTARDTADGVSFDSYIGDGGEKGLSFANYVFRFPYTQFCTYAFDAFYKAVKCRPSIMDNVFPINCEAGNTETWPFIVTLNITCSSLEPFSVAGLPY